MRLVFVTQRVDALHPTLGVAAPKIRALAARLDEVVVLADAADPSLLPDNCRVLLFAGRSRAERGARLARLLHHELSPRPLAVVAHMVPLYAIVAAPLVRPRGVPLLLWFTHWKVTRRLLLAERAASAVLTVGAGSFPLQSHKVVPIGHGIDMDAFACVARAPAARLRVLALGRTSPAKGLETIVRGAELAGAELELRGPSLTDEERAEARRLEAFGAHVEPPLPPAAVPALLARKDVLVNNMREGALDKVVYEAAATCMPVLASNAGFADVLPAELRFRRDDPVDLAERLRRLESADRGEIGHRLRARVRERHSVEHWAEAVLEVARR